MKIEYKVVHTHEELHAFETEHGLSITEITGERIAIAIHNLKEKDTALVILLLMEAVPLVIAHTMITDVITTITAFTIESETERMFNQLTGFISDLPLEEQNVRH